MAFRKAGEGGWRMQRGQEEADLTGSGWSHRAQRCRSVRVRGFTVVTGAWARSQSPSSSVPASATYQLGSWDGLVPLFESQCLLFG